MPNERIVRSGAKPADASMPNGSHLSRRYSLAPYMEDGKYVPSNPTMYATVTVRATAEWLDSLSKALRDQQRILTEAAKIKAETE